jgi:hypothetical protein
MCFLSTPSTSPYATDASFYRFYPSACGSQITMDQRCGAFDRQDSSVHPRGAAPRNAHTVNEGTLAMFSKH